MSKSKTRSSGSKKTKLRANRSLSQNFLIDGAIGDRIVAALPIDAKSTVYEVGAGKGFLTERIVPIGATILAVEKDRRMIGMLKKKFRRVDNVQLFHADVLSLPDDAEPPSGSWLLGNLPYGIGHAILQWAFERTDRWRGAIVTLQREVVRRLLAEPGAGDRSAASIWFQARATGQLLFEIPPAAFHPRPRVTSSVMWIDFTPQTPGVAQVPGIELLVRYAFAQRRKVLSNNLRAIPGLPPDFLERAHAECAHLMEKRAQELTADDFVRLAGILKIDRLSAQDS
jgi:16S rRNA (adenine1518-N6/adenine1519-N6)-dimethyltransferase